MPKAFRSKWMVPTVLLAGWITLLNAGCTLPSRQRRPTGPIGYQQLEATQFDPYAARDLGPEVVGGRPRDFDRPAAEPVRARGFRDTRWPF